MLYSIPQHMHFHLVAEMLILLNNYHSAQTEAARREGKDRGKLVQKKQAYEEARNNNEDNFINGEANELIPEINLLPDKTIILTYHSLCPQQSLISVPVVNLNGERFTNMEIQSIVEDQTQKYYMPFLFDRTCHLLHSIFMQYFCLHLQRRYNQ